MIEIEVDFIFFAFIFTFSGSAFMVGRFLTSVQWGMAADKYGRKPIMCIGVISVFVLHLSAASVLILSSLVTCEAFENLHPFSGSLCIFPNVIEIQCL
jgi:MFS family permease